MSHYDSLLNFCDRYSNIYCYGAGNMGKSTVTFLNKYGKNVKGFIVSNKTNEVSMGIKVWQWDENVNIFDDHTGIILSLNEAYHEEIIDRLKRFKNISESCFYRLTYKNVIEEIELDLAESRSYFQKMDASVAERVFIDRINSIENVKVSHFEDQYNTLRAKYKKIVFGQYDMRTIGIMGLTYYLWNIEKSDDAVLYVMTPILFDQDYSKIPNTYFYNKIQESFEIITEKNYEFWRWVLQYHRNDIEFSDAYSWSEIKKRDTDYKNVAYNGSFEVILNAEEQEIIHKMQLGSEFVCIYNRDNEYYKYRGLEIDTERYRYGTGARNMSIEDYKLLGEEYHKREVPLIRMGCHVADHVELEGIIDYANKYRTEKLDFYLISKCKFFMESNSGIMNIALIFNIPLVMVNSCVISFGGDIVAPTKPERDLIITKKLWYQGQNRYLSLDEMLFMEGRFKSYELFDAYCEIGVVFHSNSQKELFDVAEEMRNRLNGTIIYTEQDEILQKRYRFILERNIQISGNHYYDGRFGTNFLRENSWFLEDVPQELSIKRLF